MHINNLRIAIIGAGNVGIHLARILSESVAELYICSENSKLSDLTRSFSANMLSNIEDLPDDLDVYIISKRDQDIENVATKLVLKNGLLLHTSGSVDMAVFEKFALYGVLYPFQSFRKEKDLLNKDFPVFIEANNSESEQFLLNFAKLISPLVLKATLNERRKLHLAGVLSSNFVNYLFTAAYEQVHDLYEPNKVLLPLMKETVERLASGNPHDYQTGPAVRNDNISIQKHIELLEKNADLKDLYVLISSIIKKRYGV